MILDVPQIINDHYRPIRNRIQYKYRRLQQSSRFKNTGTCILQFYYCLRAQDPPFNFRPFRTPAHSMHLSLCNLFNIATLPSIITHRLSTSLVNYGMCRAQPGSFSFSSRAFLPEQTLPMFPAAFKFRAPCECRVSSFHKSLIPPPPNNNNNNAYVHCNKYSRSVRRQVLYSWKARGPRGGRWRRRVEDDDDSLSFLSCRVCLCVWSLGTTPVNICVGEGKHLPFRPSYFSVFHLLTDWKQRPTPTKWVNRKEMTASEISNPDPSFAVLKQLFVEVSADKAVTELWETWEQD